MKIESEVLKRLGPVPFWRGERRVLDDLERIYEKARDAAERQMCYNIPSSRTRGENGV